MTQNGSVDQSLQAATAEPRPPSTEGRASVGLIAFLILGVVIFLAGAFVVQFQNVDSAIKAALWGMAGTSIFWVGAALVWGAVNPGDAREPALGPLLREGANVVITVDGVVLGLIYAFVGDKSHLVPVVKVGAISLVAGVVIALTLYSLVAGNITKPAAVAIGTGLYSLAAWALAFGLLCIVAALIFP